jgi:hypothetical protein
MFIFGGLMRLLGRKPSRKEEKKGAIRGSVYVLFPKWTRVVDDTGRKGFVLSARLPRGERPLTYSVRFEGAGHAEDIPASRLERDEEYWASRGSQEQA